MNTLEYIVKKFNADLSGKSPIAIPDTNRETLAHLFKELNFKKGAEIGVEEGLYSEVLCGTNPGLELYCVDAWKAYKDYREHVTQSKIDTIYENAKKRLQKYNVKLIKKFSMDAVKDFEDDSLDFVYIDGNHTYQYVLDDITEWSKKVRKGGIVAGHDFRRDKYIPDQKVIEAVSEYASVREITFFVLGRKDKLPGEKRDRARSWFWVKQDE